MFFLKIQWQAQGLQLKLKIESQGDRGMNIITIAVCDRNEHEAGTLQKHLEQLIPGADVRLL